MITEKNFLVCLPKSMIRIVWAHEFGGVKVMDPYVRREVLSHLGYKRIDLDYVHPSWENNGEAVNGARFLLHANER